VLAEYLQLHAGWMRELTHAEQRIIQRRHILGSEWVFYRRFVHCIPWHLLTRDPWPVPSGSVYAFLTRLLWSSLIFLNWRSNVFC